MRSSVSLSRDFIEAGVDKDAADIIAEAIVTHADDSHATKADLSDLKGELKADIIELKTQMRFSLALNIGILVTIIAMFLRGTGGG